ncbi:phenylpyruvate tautomerase MIF-related protein [Inmirania thermothiophila]|uniref:L-dopachrome isomerase n=1 Tax=Inmirania thermothiophila TaxID=1750597 RepID=A0A3N1Y8I1_9GAMM|nr:phenylpyruvate tautomerase MIF-related protein [Inmirania thermothiophila]ROR35085.1 macrophage migration inhibitory factor (MIF) [Inmirania thermothiophila]
MPYLRLQTSATLAAEDRAPVLRALSRAVAEILGKPERYMMVALEDGVPMAFAGEDAPCAYLELKSIGLPRHRTEELSAALCGLVEKHLGVPAERTYIEFTDLERDLFGWNRRTFAR